jgi:serine protease Do
MTAILAFCVSVFAEDASQALALQNAFIEVAKELGPAVVSISTVHTERVGIRSYGFGGSHFEDELFDRFFRDFFEGAPQEREYQQRGLGSGVLIDPNGLILTNEHVVRGADKITVTLADARKFEGRLKGTDSRSDLALIQIDAKGLPYAQLGNSDEVKIGQWAIAIGNPFGYMVGTAEPTLTVGVVSALGRSISTAPEADKDYTGLIQTDAAINPGNSGGPLVDIYGKVIGINVAIFSTSGGYQGIGFAIPINRAKDIIPDLTQGKRIQYGWIGIMAQDLDEQLSKYFGLGDIKGALVIKVIPGAPAAASGLKEQDIIKTIDSETIENVQQLVRKISHAKPSSSIKLGVWRNGKLINITINIAARPQEAATQAEQKALGGVQGITSKWRGIEVCDITAQIAQQYNIEGASGVIVYKIEPNSPAYQAGLRIGDIIEQINRIQIENITDFSEVVNTVKGDALVRTSRGYTIVKDKAASR